MKKIPWRALAAASIIAAGFCYLVGIFHAGLSDKNVAERDFISYWAAGQQLVHGGNPYDGAAIFRLERAEGLSGDGPNITHNLPIFFFLVMPLGLVSSKTGLILWLLALLASLVVSIRIIWILHGRKDNQLRLLGYMFAPQLACLMAGQTGIFLLLGVVLFLYFYKSRPFGAGTVLLLCTLKPHLFLPFGIVLLVWAIRQKAYRILAGVGAALLAASAFSFCIDPHAWSQYAYMMNAEGLQDLFIPTWSLLFRLLVNRRAPGLQFLPDAFASAWAFWYFWTRRARWNWMEQGLLLLLVSEACAPYAWFTDEAVVLPAVLAAVYRADAAGRSLLPFWLITGAALIEVLIGVPITTPFYLWTTPAWLAWYLYATRRFDGRSGQTRSGAAAEESN